MKTIIAFNFGFIALILIGLFFITKSNFRSLNQSSKYWSVAILCDAMGLLLLGSMFVAMRDLNDHMAIGTVANTLLFASLIYQTLSIHAIGSRVGVTQRRLLILVILLFALGWEFMRTRYEANLKIVIFAVAALVLLVWQLYEVIRRMESKSFQLKIIFWSVAGEAFFTAMRLFAVAAVESEIILIEDLPLMAVISMWLQYALKIIAYAALVGYWSENLVKQKTAVDLENQQFKILSERQKQLIDELGQINRVATLGMLSASIAHEISQPLQSVLLNAEIGIDALKRDNPDPQFIRATLEEQLESANRMSQIVSTMRGVFSERRVVTPVLDFDEVIRNLALLVIPQAKNKGIELVYEKSGDTQVHAKRAEVQQVLLNLVSNAFDALAQANVAEPKIRIGCWSAEGRVYCAIEDNGGGLAEDIREDIFRFFKTSKSTGMGLGLWLSKYIVERNKGEIQAGVSQWGGAKFTISFAQA